MHIAEIYSLFMLECKRNICSYFCIFHMYINCRGLFKERITHTSFFFLTNLIHSKCITFPLHSSVIIHLTIVPLSLRFFSSTSVNEEFRELERHGVCNFSDIDIGALRKIRHETSKAIILDRTYAMRDR